MFAWEKSSRDPLESTRLAGWFTLMWVCLFVKGHITVVYVLWRKQRNTKTCYTSFMFLLGAPKKWQ